MDERRNGGPAHRPHRVPHGPLSPPFFHSSPPRLLHASSPLLAWRDSRGMRQRLLLYVAAMALGVAALVAIRSFGENLRTAVERSVARGLRGRHEDRRSAVASTERSRPWSTPWRRRMRPRRAQRCRPPRWRSFPKNGGDAARADPRPRGPLTRFTAGSTADARSAASVYQSTGGGAGRPALLLQMDAEVGDSLKVGGATRTDCGRGGRRAGADGRRRARRTARLPPAATPRLGADWASAAATSRRPTSASPTPTRTSSTPTSSRNWTPQPPVEPAARSRAMDRGHRRPDAVPRPRRLRRAAAGRDRRGVVDERVRPREGRDGRHAPVPRAQRPGRRAHLRRAGPRARASSGPSRGGAGRGRAAAVAAACWRRSCR